MKTCKVEYNNKIYEAEEGENLGAFLRALGFEGFVCGGHGKCGKCRVICRGALSAPSEAEKAALTADELSEGVRLSCMTRISGDCVVTTVTAGKSEIETDGDLPDITLSPVFKKYGAAVDIGTTTVALRLYGTNGAVLSTKSALNPQRKFGADVVSRMEAALKDGKSELAAAIRQCLCSLLRQAADGAGISVFDIDGVVITGNTVMLHLLTETDTEPLTHAPFDAKRLFGEIINAAEINLTVLNQETPVYIPRCVSAFVGADTVTALISSEAYKSEKTSVLTDIGTNGETVLIHGGGLFACSTAAGPAFEGAGISMGMGGSEGAVDKVAVKDGRIAAHVIGDKAPVGICGSGIVDAVAALYELEIMDETGFMEDGDAVIIPPVVITQNDIRAVQLAKSAIHAGIKTLLDVRGLDCSDVGTLYIAGGFGSYLDVKNAAKIGLIPSELEGRVKVLGNAALSGASAILLSSGLFGRANELAVNVIIIGLASNPVFAREYMDGMYF